MRPEMEKSENENWKWEPTGQAKPGNTRGFTGKGTGVALLEAAGRGFWTVLEANQTVFSVQVQTSGRLP